MRRLGHPSLRKLHRWVAGEDLPLDRHLSTCEYCADRLEPLLDESDESIRAALVHLLDVPEKLNDRLRTGIDERLDNQRDLLLIGEFFGLPFQTVRIMSSNDQGDD